MPTPEPDQGAPGGPPGEPGTAEVLLGCLRTAAVLAAAGLVTLAALAISVHRKAVDRGPVPTTAPGEIGLHAPGSKAGIALAERVLGGPIPGWTAVRTAELATVRAVEVERTGPQSARCYVAAPPVDDATGAHSLARMASDGSLRGRLEATFEGPRALAAARRLAQPSDPGRGDGGSEATGSFERVWLDAAGTRSLEIVRISGGESGLAPRATSCAGPLGARAGLVEAVDDLYRRITGRAGL